MTTRSWYVLHHTAGPMAPTGESVLDQALFAEHVAFLRRRLEPGELVLAGPIDDGSAAGLTVLELPSLEEATRLATEDDRAVATGLLAVEIRRWNVAMSRA